MLLLVRAVFQGKEKAGMICKRWTEQVVLGKRVKMSTISRRGVLNTHFQKERGPKQLQVPRNGSTFRQRAYWDSGPGC